MLILSRRGAPVGALILAAALAGCSGGSQYAPVKGKVTHKGQPLAGATVVFTPDSKDATASTAPAITKEDGTYELQTNLPGGKTMSGAALGSYKVTVSKFVPPKGMSEAEFDRKVEAAGSGVYSDADRIQKVELVPPAYSSIRETKVTATVSAGAPTEVNVTIP